MFFDSADTESFLNFGDFENEVTQKLKDRSMELHHVIEEYFHLVANVIGGCPSY